MGNNLDLIDMFGLPENIKCPRCKEIQSSFFDEYDIECGEPFKKGKWKLHCHCVGCDHEWEYKFKIEIKLNGGIV